METSMKETLKNIIFMEKVDIPMPMETGMKASLAMEQKQAEVHTISFQDIIMWVNSKVISCMAMESIITQTEIDMKENSLKANNMGKEYITMQLVANLKAHSSMEKKMEKGQFTMQMEWWMLAYGMMESDPNDPLTLISTLISQFLL